MSGVTAVVVVFVLGGCSAPIESVPRLSAIPTAVIDVMFPGTPVLWRGKGRKVGEPVVYKRSGCSDQGRACPDLADEGHGSWYFAIQVLARTDVECGRGAADSTPQSTLCRSPANSPPPMAPVVSQRGYAPTSWRRTTTRPHQRQHHGGTPGGAPPHQRPGAKAGTAALTRNSRLPLA